jgi:hypothetical protein
MTAVKEASMQLTPSPEVVQWPESITSSSRESALSRTTLPTLGRSYTNSSQILHGKIRSLATSVFTKSSLRSIAPAYPSQSNLATCRRVSCMKSSAVVSISASFSPAPIPTFLTPAAEFSRSFPMASSRFAMISISKTMSMTREQHPRTSSSQKSCSQEH